MYALFLKMRYLVSRPLMSDIKLSRHTGNNMELTQDERNSGLLIVKCRCCGNEYKAHQLSNSLAYSLTPNYGCYKCKGESDSMRL